ncbi:cobalamin B12-binding domain-containing protein [Planctomycetota bacterium]
MSSRKIRILLGKIGLDGHNRGVHVVAAGLRDAGFEVIYTGIRQTPMQIAEAALQEDVDCVGLSSLAGAHLPLFPQTAALLRDKGLESVLLFCGGVIPTEDLDELKNAGFKAIFTPGTPIAEIVKFIHKHLEKTA